MTDQDVVFESTGAKGEHEQGVASHGLPESAAFLGNSHPAVQDQLGAASALPVFLKAAGRLSLADRQLLVEQAMLLFELTYVHLPMKRAMHAIDPVQRLKLLQYRMSQLDEDRIPGEIAFHNEMTDIFTSTRDLHTNYLLPAPFNQVTAFLPFLVEEYFEDGAPKYQVTMLASGFSHPTFARGVEVLYWNGMPIKRAIEVNGERQAGSNPEARFARGLDSLTIRPLLRSLPPNEEWVVIGYRSLDGRELELKQDWLVFSPQPGPGGVDPNASLAEATSLAIDIQTDAINTAKKILFAPQAVAAEEMVAERDDLRAALTSGVSTSMPGVFRANPIETEAGTFGYIRIFTFNVNNADKFLAEFVRLAEALPQDGLIVDVRNNGGGLVLASEGLLQLLTPRRIEPERAQFINTPLNLRLCRRHAPSTLWTDFDLSPWVDSIAQAVATGAAYSLGFPITDEKWCNSIGQVYHGPVVLVTDALCYSATDILAAGFQDHKIGPILGASANTGAGGANVWTHSLLQLLMDEPGSPFKSLPNGAGMRVAIRRTLRVGSQAGYPLEDLGVVPDFLHQMTRDDLLEGNVDLLDRAASILAGMPVYKLKANLTSRSNSRIRLTVTTANITRLDVYVDGRPLQSRDVSDGSLQLRLDLPSQDARVLELRGFKGGDLVAARKLKL